MPCKQYEDLDLVTVHGHADRAHLLVVLGGIVIELLGLVVRIAGLAPHDSGVVLVSACTGSALAQLHWLTA
jgi:hypothetical protein